MRIQRSDLEWYILQVSWRKKEKTIRNKLMNLLNRSTFFKVFLLFGSVAPLCATDLLTLGGTGQVRQLRDEMVLLREQTDASSGLSHELQSSRDEVKSLKRALEAAAAERDRDVGALQTNLATASKDLDQWRQTASKYERDIADLQRDLQQQSLQWQKTAEIQGSTLGKRITI